MLFRLVALHQVAEHVKIIFFPLIQIIPVSQFINDFHRSVQVFFCPDRAKRETLDQFQVSISATADFPLRFHNLLSLFAPAFTPASLVSSILCSSRRRRGEFLPTPRLPILAEGIAFPLSRVVLLVRENESDKELVALVVDHGNEPILVATDVEDYLVADEICRMIRRANISKTRPVGGFYYLIPCSQRRFRAGMSRIAPEEAELFWRNHAHVNSFLVAS